MPTYELALVLRQMSRPEIISTLKRTAKSIYDKDGIIRKLENLGTHQLPHKTSKHGLIHKTASYFIFQFDTPPTKIEDLNEEFNRDIDILRNNIFKLQKESEFECTLHDELQPPAYRKDVQEMIKISQKKQKPKFNYGNNLDYYPFQK